jgi:hypothetical protein
MNSDEIRLEGIKELKCNSINQNEQKCHERKLTLIECIRTIGQVNSRQDYPRQDSY